MSIVIDKLRRSELFTEDEIDTLHRYKLDLDGGRVGINEYMEDGTEENWNKSWALVGEMYTRAQSKVDRWKMILVAHMLTVNRDHAWSIRGAYKTSLLMSDDLREGGMLDAPVKEIDNDPR